MRSGNALMGGGTLCGTPRSDRGIAAVKIDLRDALSMGTISTLAFMHPARQPAQLVFTQRKAIRVPLVARLRLATR